MKYSTQGITDFVTFHFPHHPLRETIILNTSFRKSVFDQNTNQHQPYLFRCPAPLKNLFAMGFLSSFSYSVRHLSSGKKIRKYVRWLQRISSKKENVVRQKAHNIRSQPTMVVTWPIRSPLHHYVALLQRAIATHLGLPSLCFPQGPLQARFQNNVTPINK